MGAAISLRDDFSSADLHDFAKASMDADQTRRLLVLAAIYDGARRSEAARVGGVQAASPIAQADSCALQAIGGGAREPPVNVVDPLDGRG